jgi:hypothetical protein
MTPEERSAYAKRIRAKVKPESLRRPSPKAGVPQGWTKAAFEDAQALAKRDARKFLERMERDGPIVDSEVAREATLMTLTLLRQPGPKRQKLEIARTLLTFFKVRPGVIERYQRQTTAEDLIDQLAASEGRNG